ncbi:Cdc6/Cdc18 family protein [Haloprofundus salilacus]|uniref:Cdc6/Cdc18 family protein n=1 Tax=Haloprofundus salilacus TaxID=2876190 RepID=UPI001CCBB3E4|nr:AAA family ATPase [Haloprofundus salilacus]
MTNYDDLFAETAPTNSVFADKAALNPLTPSKEIIARDEQERQLATLLNGIHEGYLPPTVSVHGPPGTGKTMTTRRVCEEFATRHEEVAVEYVNLKECRTIFSVANELLRVLSGEPKQAWEGLDGVFAGIWAALEVYPAWTVLILDEIDHIAHDSNYDPSEFFYRLLRGEGRLQRNIQLSVFLLSNELLEVDLRLDSRVKSAMSGEQIFFPPYSRPLLRRVLAPRVEQAFKDGVLPESVFEYGIRQAAARWGDARKTMTLFRRAGETANERGLAVLNEACIDANLELTEKETTIEKLAQVPPQHYLVLRAVTGYKNRETGETAQPVTTKEVEEAYSTFDLPTQSKLGERAIREVVTELETMGLVETWVDSRGRDGRIKQIQTTFDPEWVFEARSTYMEVHRRTGANEDVE